MECIAAAIRTCSENGTLVQCAHCVQPQATPALANLLHRMLEVDPHERITAGEILAHPWVVKDMPSGLASLNSRLAAARSGALALQVSAAAPGRRLQSPTICSDSSSRIGTSAAGCGGGRVAGSKAACGGCHVSAGGLLLSDPPRLGGIALSPAELRALVQRAAAQDQPLLRAGPTKSQGGRRQTTVSVDARGGLITCVPVYDGKK